MSHQTVKTNIYDVRIADMDDRYRLTPCQLLSYYQDAVAFDYADNGIAAFHLEKQGLSWILGDMTARFEEVLPYWKEKVVIKTWNSRARGLKVLRDFVALNEKGVIIASGTSTWFIVNKESMKPVLLKDFEHALPESSGPEGVLTDPALTKPSVDTLKIDASLSEELLNKADFLREKYDEGQNSWVLKRQARTSDIDFNGHVNNLRYVAGALETIPPELRKGLYLDYLYVKFTAEAKLDDDVSSLCVMTGEEKAFNHHLLSPDGSVQYSVLQSKWRVRS